MKKQIAIYLLIGIGCFILGVASVLLREKIILSNMHLPASNTPIAKEKGNNESVSFVKESQKPERIINSIGGDILEINDNLIKLKVFQPTSTADTKEASRTNNEKEIVNVEVDNSTKIFRFIVDRAELQEHKGTAIKEFPKEQVNISDLKIGDGVIVRSKENIAGLKYFKASEIDIYQLK